MMDFTQKDETQLIKDIIRDEVVRCKSNLKQVKDEVTRIFEKRKNRLDTTVGIRRDIEECRRMMENLTYSICNDGYSFENFTAVFYVAFFLLLPLIVRVDYYFCTWAWEHLKIQYEKVSLSTIDHAYIERKYIKCCLELWLDEAVCFINELNKNESQDSIQDILYSVDTFNNFNQIPESLSRLKYNKLLIENHKLIGSDDEQKFINQFKSEFLEQVVFFNDSIEIELNFLQVFVDFLLAHKNIQGIIVELQLEDFCCDRLSFDKFLENIVAFKSDAYRTHLANLQELANALKNESEFVLVKKFRVIFSEYLKPPKLELRKVDDRSIIEVTSKIIAVSEILSQLETEIERKKSAIEEIRFVAADILHIDTDLKKHVWHGKNIVIFGKKIKVHGKVTWNVSGIDSDHIYSDDAGTGANGHGNQGDDGHAGESGGNILIQVDEMENAENFTIVSHGGKGGRGQDGGDGINGKDGKGISRSDFEEKFKPLVPAMSTPWQRGQLLRDTTNHIKSITTGAEDKCDGGDVFIVAKTNEGNEITFSFCSAIRSFTWTSNFQAFLIYRGSLGDPGGQGGEYGLGGEGGYAGEIITNNFNIVVDANPGKDGDNGKGGLCGDHGKNGWDMGYTDYQYWKETVYFGRQQNSKLRLEYYSSDDDSRSRIWCPYHEKYAEISATRIENKKDRKYEERKNTRQNMERKHQMRATKKKAISREKISAEYAQYSTSMGRSYSQNLQSNLANIRQRTLERIVENSEQQEKVTTETKVKRHVDSIHRDNRVHGKKTGSAIYNLTSRDNRKSDVESLIDELKKNSFSDTWLDKLKSIELDHSELDQLFATLRMLENVLSSISQPPDNTENNKLQNIKQILNEKYRFAVLQKISTEPSFYQENSKATLENYTTRYLVVAKENDDDTYHDILGTLNQYLFVDGKEHREKISKYSTEKLLKTNDEALKRSIRAFVLEVGKSEQIDTVVETYYDEYDEFIEKHEHSLHLVHSGLQRNINTFAPWIQNNNNKTVKVSEEIQNYEFFSAFYNRFNNLLEEAYEWDECCGNKEFFKKYNHHMQQKGPLSVSYRELLAHVFDINIRLYKEDENNQLCLIDNHNPSSDEVIHILRRGNKLLELNIDENYLRLEAGRKKIGHVYTQILAKTEALKLKQEFDDYFDTKDFSFDIDLFEYDYLYQHTKENRKEKHENVSDSDEFDTGESSKKNNDAVMQSIRAFIVEVGETENVTYPNAGKYFYEYKEFLKIQKKKLSKLFEPFHQELVRHRQIFALWIASNNNKSIKLKLMNEIRRHAFLETLYRHFDKQIKREYSWTECCKDKALLKERDHFDRRKLASSKNSEEGIEEGQKNRDTLHARIIASNILQKLNHFSEKEEQEHINGIVKYFSSPEQQLQIKKRLEKITSQYTGQQSILHIILNRFSNDGRHVSFQGLCFLVNSILGSVTEDKTELNIFCWIVAAYPQKYWIDELMLLQLENYFKKSLTETKSKWRQYLSKIGNKDILLSLGLKLGQHKSSNPISTQCIEDTLYLLSNIPNGIVDLKDLELSDWPCALKGEYWTCKLLQLTDWGESKRLSEASYYLLSVENTFGTATVERFVEILKWRKLSPDKLTDTLYNFYSEKWNLGEEELKILPGCSYDEWVRKMRQKFMEDGHERDISQLVQLIKGNSNTSKGISDKLLEIENAINSIDKREFKKASRSNNKIEKHTKGYQKSGHQKNQSIKQSYIDMLAKIDKTIESKRGFKLRHTQKLAVLALLANDRNTLAQVSTGEGKSLIVVTLSIIKALCKEKVEIITSSSVLAKRDAEINKDIYDEFGIGVSHNCDEDIDKRRQAYSGGQVVYGDLSNFQRDYLLDRFYGKNILGDRKFENVIVDEVDSMLLDKGNNMLYLSHDLVGFDKLESVYIYIWQWVSRPARSQEELAAAFDIEAIKEAVLHNLHGLLTKKDIEKLGCQLKEQQVKMIWSRLVEAKIFDDQGKMLKEKISDNEIQMILSPNLSDYENRLRYLLEECIGRDKFVNVPNFLKPFIEQHLDTWINSAIMAVVMQERHDYIVDVDRTGTSPNLDPNITILDRDTGTDQGNSQWGDALHQFLQLKHGCKLSLQSLKAVFISNVSYLKLYRKLYGLTGTLGSQKERNLLKEIHGVDFVTIPTARSKQFYEEIPILCEYKTKWIEQVFNEAIEFTEKRHRSVLIICETIDDAETLNRYFLRMDTKHVHTYTRDYEEFEIAQGDKELNQERIIIATNLSGRGTDIKITKGLREAGGLHVCLTYLPNNSRIEQQAFGRAARSGDKGSGRLIIVVSKGQEYSNSKVLDLRKERDTEELHRISNIKAYYETQIKSEEECFNEFQKQYESLNNHLTANHVHREVINIFLQSCLDKWAFWLDKNGENLKNITNERSKKNFENSLTEFISQLNDLKSGDTGIKEKYGLWGCIKDVATLSVPQFSRLSSSNQSKNWLTWIIEQPIQVIKLGRYFLVNANHDYAIELFDKVIAQEPCFSEVAHYYKAMALLKKMNSEKESLDKATSKAIKTELQEAARLVNERIECSHYATGVISNLKQHNNRSIIQINGYAEQHKNLSNLYYIFLQSIDTILGQTVTSGSFVNYDINEDLAEILYEDLLKNGILKKPKMKKVIPEEALNKISFEYGISILELKTCLSKFQGKTIDEKKFQETLESGVKLPSREYFWNELIQRNILYEEIEYVTVDVEKMETVDSSILNSLREKIDIKELEEQTLESANSNEILLHAVHTVPRDDSNTEPKEFITLKKDAFKEIITIDEEKYEVLTKKGVFSFNKRAFISRRKLASFTFSHYDSITLEDFSKQRIAKNDGEKILAELVEKNILEKSDSENDIYQLTIPFDKIQLIQLPSFPVYQSAVKALISLCFSYRIALEKIEKQLKEKNFPVYPLLPSKPHHKLIYELMDQKIIKSVKVSTGNADLEEKLKNIYPEPSLGDHLLSTMPPVDTLLTTILKPQRLLLEIAGVGIKSASLYEYLTKKNDQLLDKRSKLGNKDTIKQIFGTLERMKGSLKTLETPDGFLKPLTEYCSPREFQNIEELHVFGLNAMDHLLRLDEKKWTKAMLFNTAIVIAMGVTQIAIGALIELFSVGLMTHVGAAFLSEGVSDLFFAAEACSSGYFSWKAYKDHKITSLMLTAMTGGLGAYLSRGTKVSSVGYKLFGPAFEAGGKKVAQQSGFQLMKNIGTRVVAKEVLKRVIYKTANGILMASANAGVDAFIKNWLRGLCQRISSTILSNISKEVEGHKISATLEKTYQVLGKEKAMNLINDLTQSCLSEKTLIEKLSSTAFKIANGVTKGITNAAKKMSKAGQNIYTSLITVISKICALIPSINQLTQVANIRLIASNFLYNLEIKLTQKLDNHKSKKETRQDAKDGEQDVTEDCKSFKMQTIESWQALLNEKAGQVVETHIVSPVLHKGVDFLIDYCKREIVKKYQSYEADKNKEELKNLKRKYQQNREDTSGRELADLTEVEREEMKTYHQELVKLAARTRDPEIYATILEENIPLDFLGVSAYTKVIGECLALQGRGGVTIVITGENGTRQEFSSNTGEVSGGEVIELVLKDNHYELSGGGGESSNNQNSESINNCFYDALSQRLNIDISPEDLRTQAAHRIREDPNLRHHVQQGWHALPISNFGAFGGQKDIDMTSKELYDKMMDKKILLSQDSIANQTNKNRPPVVTLENLAESIKGGWNGDRINMVSVKEGEEEILITLDNRRAVAGASTNSEDVTIKTSVYEENEVLPDEIAGHYARDLVAAGEEVTAGAAATKRKNAGWVPFEGIGNPVDNLVVRGSVSRDGTPEREFEKKIEAMGAKYEKPQYPTNQQQPQRARSNSRGRRSGSKERTEKESKKK